MSKPKWQPTLLIRATVALHVIVLVALVVIPSQWLVLLAMIMINHIVITIIGLWPRSHALGPNWTRLPDAAIARNEVALTIDDGPDPMVTPQVLDILDKYHIKATFFCIANKAAQYPELCQDIIHRGHAVENHSQHHRHYFSLLGYEAIKHELHTAQATLTKITGQRPLFFRPPAGLRNPFLDPVLTQLELKLATWSVRGFDTRSDNVEHVLDKLTAGLQAGAILLLHDGNAARTSENMPVIVEVLPALLTSAKAMNLRFVTLRNALS
tara:strand:- start:87230 stop:88033 length:804 start_codon:yes stop_codon:yes gene_type:complete